MEDFRKQVKKTLIIYIAVLIAAIVIFVTLNVIEIAGILEEKLINDLSNGFGTGVCTAIIVFMAIAICRCRAALKNDEKLKKLYILETDERERLIYEKTNSASFRTVIILLGFAAMVSSFFSKTVFYTIVAIIMVIAFVQTIFKFYYRRKF